MQVGRLAMMWATEALEPLGLSLHQFAALALVQHFGGISQRGVAERLGLSKSAMSGIATNLERRRLLQRPQHLYDPQRRALYITRGGGDLLADASTELARIDARFRRLVGQDVIQALGELPPPELSAIEQALLAAGWG